MDAVKCIKEFNRMCRSYDCCSDGCPLKRRCILFRGQNTDSETIEELVAAVEKWSKVADPAPGGTSPTRHARRDHQSPSGTFTETFNRDSEKSVLLPFVALQTQ